MDLLGLCMFTIERERDEDGEILRDEDGEIQVAVPVKPAMVS